MWQPTINQCLSCAEGGLHPCGIQAVLAASPDTSLRFGWNTTYQQKGEFNHTTLPGSDQTFSYLELGVGSVLTSRLFLDASLDVGLTRDTPDFQFTISFPYRF